MQCVFGEGHRCSTSLTPVAEQTMIRRPAAHQQTPCADVTAVLHVIHDHNSIPKKAILLLYRVNAQDDMCRMQCSTLLPRCPPCAVVGDTTRVFLQAHLEPFDGRTLWEGADVLRQLLAGDSGVPLALEPADVLALIMQDDRLRGRLVSTADVPEVGTDEVRVWSRAAIVMCSVPCGRWGTRVEAGGRTGMQHAVLVDLAVLHRGHVHHFVPVPVH